MRKRGKHGLNNVIYPCKIGGFMPYFVGDLEWGNLKTPSTPGVQVTPGAAACIPVSSPGCSWNQLESTGIRVIHNKHESRIDMR